MSLKGLRFTLRLTARAGHLCMVNFRLIQNQSYPFVIVWMSPAILYADGEMLLEKATLTIWQGVIPQRYVTGVVAGFGMQENNGWQMRYHLRIEPPLWRWGCGRTSASSSSRISGRYHSTLLNENGVTEWTPLFYGPSGAGVLCAVRESDLAFWRGCGRRDFLLERFAADSPEQKLTLCDDVAGCQAGSFRLTRTHRQERDGVCQYVPL